MAKETNETPNTAVDNINNTLSGIEQKVQNNTRPVMIGIVVVIAIVCLVLFYFYGIRQPAIQAANDAIGEADVEMALGNDSTALAIYKNVASEHSYDAGNRAKLNAAIILYRQGKYDEAIKYLNDYDASDNVIGAAAKSLEGDCYVNKKQYDEALKYFEEAVKLSDDNPSYTPTFLLKEATVYTELKNYTKAAEIYQQINEKYPRYGAMMGIDMEMRLEAAKEKAAAK